ncbi:MAG: hypothetical protein ACT4RN_05570 [Pseudonocardia sp.]
MIAALDPGIAPRLLAAHPAQGWCSRCRTAAPCSARRIGEAARDCAAQTPEDPAQVPAYRAPLAGPV